jgi:SGNH domain (fused to AT3 domains)
MGDSMANRLSLTVREALWDDYQVTTSSITSCPVPPVEKDFPTEEMREECSVGRQAFLDRIAIDRPDVVILTSVYGALSSGAEGAAAAAEWQSALHQILPQIVASAGKVILISSPPFVKQLADCATKTSRPPACVDSISNQWVSLAKAEADSARADGASFMDTSLWYCSVRGPCPSFVGTTPMRFDNVHVTSEYASLLVPVFNARFDSIMAG